MKILIATDGSVFSQAAIVECCKMFEKAENVEIKLLAAAELATVAAEPFAISADFVQQINSAAQKQVTDFVSTADEKIRRQFPALAKNLTTKIELGSPERVIVEAAEQWGADLIVVGSHGRGFWERVFLGSVSTAVVQQAPCSVLVVRTREKLNKILKKSTKR